jgi:hypothetical protein
MSTIKKTASKTKPKPKPVAPAPKPTEAKSKTASAVQQNKPTSSGSTSSTKSPTKSTSSSSRPEANLKVDKATPNEAKSQDGLKLSDESKESQAFTAGADKLRQRSDFVKRLRSAFFDNKSNALEPGGTEGSRDSGPFDGLTKLGSTSDTGEVKGASTSPLSADAQERRLAQELATERGRRELDLMGQAGSVNSTADAKLKSLIEGESPKTVAEIGASEGTSMAAQELQARRNHLRDQESVTKDRLKSQQTERSSSDGIETSKLDDLDRVNPANSTISPADRTRQEKQTKSDDLDKAKAVPSKLDDTAKIQGGEHPKVEDSPDNEKGGQAKVQGLEKSNDTSGAKSEPAGKNRDSAQSKLEAGQTSETGLRTHKDASVKSKDSTASKPDGVAKSKESDSTQAETSEVVKKPGQSKVEAVDKVETASKPASDSSQAAQPVKEAAAASTDKKADRFYTSRGPIGLKRPSKRTAAKPAERFYDSAGPIGLKRPAKRKAVEVASNDQAASAKPSEVQLGKTSQEQVAKSQSAASVEQKTVASVDHETVAKAPATPLKQSVPPKPSNEAYSSDIESASTTSKSKIKDLGDIEQGRALFAEHMARDRSQDQAVSTQPTGSSDAKGESVKVGARKPQSTVNPSIVSTPDSSKVKIAEAPPRPSDPKAQAAPPKEEHKSGLFGALESLGDKAKSVAGAVVDKAKDVVSDGSDKVKDTAGTVLEKTKEVAGSLVDKSKETAGAAVDKAKDGLGDLANTGQALASGGGFIGKAVGSIFGQVGGALAAAQAEKETPVKDVIARDSQEYRDRAKDLAPALAKIEDPERRSQVEGILAGNGRIDDSVLKAFGEKGSVDVIADTDPRLKQGSQTRQAVFNYDNGTISLAEGSFSQGKLNNVVLEELGHFNDDRLLSNPATSEGWNKLTERGFKAEKSGRSINENSKSSEAEYASEIQAAYWKGPKSPDYWAAALAHPSDLKEVARIAGRGDLSQETSVMDAVRGTVAHLFGGRDTTAHNQHHGDYHTDDQLENTATKPRQSRGSLFSTSFRHEESGGSGTAVAGFTNTSNNSAVKPASETGTPSSVPDKGPGAASSLLSPTTSEPTKVTDPKPVVQTTVLTAGTPAVTGQPAQGTAPAAQGVVDSSQGGFKPSEAGSSGLVGVKAGDPPSASGAAATVQEPTKATTPAAPSTTAPDTTASGNGSSGTTSATSNASSSSSGSSSSGSSSNYTSNNNYQTNYDAGYSQQNQTANAAYQQNQINGALDQIQGQLNAPGSAFQDLQRIDSLLQSTPQLQNALGDLNQLASNLGALKDLPQVAKQLDHLTDMGQALSGIPGAVQAGQHVSELIHQVKDLPKGARLEDYPQIANALKELPKAINELNQLPDLVRATQDLPQHLEKLAALPEIVQGSKELANDKRLLNNLKGSADTTAQAVSPGPKSTASRTMETAGREKASSNIQEPKPSARLPKVAQRVAQLLNLDMPTAQDPSKNATKTPQNPMAGKLHDHTVRVTESKAPLAKGSQDRSSLDIHSQSSIKNAGSTTSVRGAKSVAGTQVQRQADSTSATQGVGQKAGSVADKSVVTNTGRIQEMPKQARDLGKLSDLAPQATVNLKSFLQVAQAPETQKTLQTLKQWATTPSGKDHPAQQGLDVLKQATQSPALKRELVRLEGALKPIIGKQSYAQTVQHLEHSLDTKSKLQGAISGLESASKPEVREAANSLRTASLDRRTITQLDRLHSGVQTIHEAKRASQSQVREAKGPKVPAPVSHEAAPDLFGELGKTVHESLASKRLESKAEGFDVFVPRRLGAKSSAPAPVVQAMVSEPSASTSHQSTSQAVHSHPPQGGRSRERVPLGTVPPSDLMEGRKSPQKDQPIHSTGKNVAVSPVQHAASAVQNAKESRRAEPGVVSHPIHTNPMTDTVKTDAPPVPGVVHALSNSSKSEAGQQKQAESMAQQVMSGQVAMQTSQVAATPRPTREAGPTGNREISFKQSTQAVRSLTTGKGTNDQLWSLVYHSRTSEGSKGLMDTLETTVVKGGSKKMQKLFEASTRNADATLGFSSVLANLSQSQGDRLLGTILLTTDGAGGKESVHQLFNKMSRQQDSSMRLGQFLENSSKTQPGVRGLTELIENWTQPEHDLDWSGASELGSVLANTSKTIMGSRSVSQTLQNIAAEEGGGQTVARTLNRLSRSKEGSQEATNLLQNLAFDQNGAAETSKLLARASQSRDGARQVLDSFLNMAKTPSGLRNVGELFNQLADAPQSANVWANFAKDTNNTGPLAELMEKINSTPESSAMLGQAFEKMADNPKNRGVWKVFEGRVETSTLLTQEFDRSQESAADSSYYTKSSPTVAASEELIPNTKSDRDAEQELPAKAAAAEASGQMSRAEALLSQRAAETHNLNSLVRGSLEVRLEESRHSTELYSTASEQTVVQRKEETVTENRGSFRPGDYYSEETLKQAKICGQCGYRTTSLGFCPRCAVNNQDG